MPNKETWECGTPESLVLDRLPSGSAERKEIPLATGVLDYFPDALAAVARLSKVGNDKHNPNEPLHWSREKSSDHADCILRHMIDRGKVDTDGIRHSVKVAWRALAMLQIELENEQACSKREIDNFQHVATLDVDYRKACMT